jgi:tetratricopeptide (TPR) repeat protein
MSELLWSKELGKLNDQYPEMFGKLDGWNLENEEVLRDFLRALRRKKGFGLFFVQCNNPAQGERVMASIRKQFPQKRLQQFDLNRESETLYGEMQERYKQEPFEVACITGVEQVLFGYEDTKRLAGWTSQEIYNYSWKGVPPLLSHLNRQREAFESNLPVALVFLVRGFVVDYFIQRAPDFFDWRSGFFKFIESAEDLQKSSQNLIDRDYQEYCSLTPDQRMEKVLEIKDKILQFDLEDGNKRSSLFREQGRLFQSGGDSIEALDCYHRSLTANPKNHNTWSSKGILLSDLERYEEAVESYDKALEINPDDPVSWISRGEALCDLERYEEAIESYDKALEINSCNPSTWHGRGILLHSSKRYEEAIESYNKALEIKTNNPSAWLLKGISLHDLERYQEAVESYNKALEIKPDYLSVWNFRGKSLRALERYEEAIKSYDKALEINSDDSYAWCVRGEALRALERYEEAIKSYDKALRTDSDDSSAWRVRGEALRALERYEEAIKSYDKALRTDSDDSSAWRVRGEAFRALKRYEEAIKSYDKALRINPDDSSAWRVRGEALRDLERYEEAIKSYDKALRINPDDSSAWRVRGEALRALERYEEAIKSYEKSLEIKSDDPSTWINKGVAMYELGKHREASDCFAEVAKIQPSDKYSWNNQGYLNLVQDSYGLQPIFEKPLLIRHPQYCSGSLAKVDIDLERCQKSLVLFETALQLDPEFTLAWANDSFPAYYLQQYQTALQSCDRALELDPDNQEDMNEVIHANRGSIFLQLHNPTSALQDFTSALTLAPHLDEAWIGKGTALFQLGRYSEAQESFSQALALNHPLAQANLDLVGQQLLETNS